jgi:fructosamine-3-kinase
MSSDLPSAVVERLRDDVDSEVVGVRSMGGGSIGHAFRCELADGRACFVKLYDGDPGMLAAEAHGLHWLAQAGAIRIPSVWGYGDAAAPYIALEYLDAAPRVPDFDERLGRQLAALHTAGPPSFGLDRSNFIGSLPQDNDPTDTWSDLYRSRRLAPLVERAGSQLARLRGDFDRLYDKLDDLCGPAEPPARLHGDLWGGNLVVDEHGSPALIDPAVYGGHREVDLAMMQLFGGFSRRTFDAYDEAFPLAPDWRDRVPLYQLYPLLVHVNLFGRGYVGQVAAALRRYV